MHCPECGYLMKADDLECPRCVRLEARRQVKEQLKQPASMPSDQHSSMLNEDGTAGTVTRVKCSACGLEWMPPPSACPRCNSQAVSQLPPENHSKGPGFPEQFTPPYSTEAYTANQQPAREPRASDYPDYYVIAAVSMLLPLLGIILGLILNTRPKNPVERSAGMSFGIYGLVGALLWRMVWVALNEMSK